MIKGFEFVDAGRSYSCLVEGRGGKSEESWWWFAVSGDGQRYAPFQASAGDTRASVQERIVAFYTNRLFRLTQPTVRGSGRFGRRDAPAAATVPAVADPPAPVPVVEAEA